MKRIILYIKAIFLLLVLSSATVHEDSGKDKQKQAEISAEISSMATSLLNAINYYKNDERAQCATTLMEQLKFELIKDVTHQVPKNCTVDSLVVGNDELSRWGYFKTVDLEYVRDVEVMITMKSPYAHEVAQMLTNMLKEQGFNLDHKSDTNWEFVDRQGGYVVDNRFQLPVQSRIGSKYHYHLEVLEDYLIVDIKEVMSDSWSADKLPDKDELQRLSQNISKRNQ